MALAVAGTPAAATSGTTGVAAAENKVIGDLAVEPAQGMDHQGNIRLISSADCPPQTTHFVVRADGGGFPTGSNAVGNNEIGEFMAGTTGKGLVVPLHATWNDVALTNGAKDRLQGVVELTLQCADKFLTKVYAEMVGKVRFTGDGKKPASYEQVGGPMLRSGIPLTAEEAEAQAAAVAANSSDLLPEGLRPRGDAAAASGNAEAGSGNSGAVPDGTSTSATASSRAELNAQAAGQSTGDGSGSSALPVVIAAFVIAALALGAVFALRRIRADESFADRT